MHGRVTCRTSPGARANLLGERRHLLQHRVHFGHDVFAIDQNRRVGFVSQRNMQHSTATAEKTPCNVNSSSKLERKNNKQTARKTRAPIFSNVDFLASEHRLDLLLETRLARQLGEQLDRLLSDDVL